MWVLLEILNIDFIYFIEVVIYERFVKLVENCGNVYYEIIRCNFLRINLQCLFFVISVYDVCELVQCLVFCFGVCFDKCVGDDEKIILMCLENYFESVLCICDFCLVK